MAYSLYSFNPIIVRIPHSIFYNEILYSYASFCFFVRSHLFNLALDLVKCHVSFLLIDRLEVYQIASFYPWNMVT